MKKLILFLCLALVGQAQAQTTLRLPWRKVTTAGASASSGNTVTLTVTYASPPTSPTANFAVLKYNKLAWFQYERDDLLSATWTDYQFFQGKTFTDGAGNAVNWRGNVVANARSNFNNGDLWGVTGKLTASQVATMVQTGKWSVSNHGYYHDLTGNFVPTSGTTFSQAGWSLAQNQKYTYDKLTAQGVENVMRVVVVPSNFAGFTRGADSLQFLGSTSQTGKDSYTAYPTNTALNTSNAGGNFVNEENVPVNGNSLFGNTGFIQYSRNFQDTWSDANINILKAQFVDLVAKSSNSKHLGMRLGTHLGTYPEMSNFFNYADSVANDQVWFVGMTEQLEYREVKRLAQKSQSLSGNVLTITIDLSALPALNRFRDMSLIVTGGTISNVSVTGADRFTYNTSTGLVNVFKEKTTGFPAP